MELEPFLVELRELVSRFPQSEILVVLDPEGREDEVVEARPLVAIEVDRTKGQVAFRTEPAASGVSGAGGIRLEELLARLESEARPDDSAWWVGGTAQHPVAAELVGIGVDEESQRVGLVRERLSSHLEDRDEWGRKPETGAAEPRLLPRPKPGTES